MSDYIDRLAAKVGKSREETIAALKHQCDGGLLPAAALRHLLPHGEGCGCGGAYLQRPCGYGDELSH